MATISNTLNQNPYSFTNLLKPVNTSRKRKMPAVTPGPMSVYNPQTAYKPPVQGVAPTTPSPATYKGVPITIGNQKDIQSQIARIDGQNAQRPVRGLVSPTVAPRAEHLRDRREPRVEAPVQNQGFPGIVSNLVQRAGQPSSEVADAYKNQQEKLGLKKSTLDSALKTST